MADNQQFDSSILTEKESIRQNIRNALSNKMEVVNAEMDINMNAAVYEKIDNPVAVFVEKFRSNGGLFVPCNNQDLIQTLVRLCRSQQYETILSTSPFFSQYLAKNQIPYVTAVSPGEPADAAVIASNVLIARTGSVGFAQEMNVYPSVKGLARDLIVISRERCVFSDLDDALDFQARKNENNPFPMTEFIRPTHIEKVDGKPQCTPINPRIILFLVSDHEPQNEESAR